MPIASSCTWSAIAAAPEASAGRGPKPRRSDPSGGSVRELVVHVVLVDGERLLVDLVRVQVAIARVVLGHLLHVLARLRVRHQLDELVDLAVAILIEPLHHRPRPAVERSGAERDLTLELLQEVPDVPASGLDVVR